MTISLNLESKAGSPTWNETTIPFNEATEMWETLGTVWTKESKNSAISLSLEDKIERPWDDGNWDSGNWDERGTRLTLENKN